MNGDIDSGFELYGSAVTQNRSLGQGWGSVGGTSESAPLFAGIAAIADQAAGRPLGPLNPYLYRAYQLPGHGGIVPVTSGNNTVAIESSNGTPVAVPGYAATDGFNLATGLGTVDAAKLVMALTHLARD
jgi:subtilase family serine protease